MSASTSSRIAGAALAACVAAIFGAVQARASIIEDVTINTTSLAGTSGNLAFDFIDGGPPSNTVTISGFASDGTLGSSTLTGGASGSLPGTIHLADSSFFNEYLTMFTFGNSIRFQVTQTANPPALGSSPDEFSFYLLDSTATNSLVTTSDPTGADSLFAIGSDTSVATFTSTQVTTTLVSTVPEPSAAVLLAGAILLLALCRRRRVWVAIALLACSTVPGRLLAQGFTFTKIVDTSTPRPDGGNFSNPHHPSTDGSYVVWNEEAGNFSVWSANISTLNLTKLADTNTPVPGGTGNFTGFGGETGGINVSDIEIRSGNVVFNGHDSVGEGLYSTTATGAPIQLIVNYGVTLPNGGVIGMAGHPFGNFGLTDGGVVGFGGFESGSAPDGTAFINSIFTTGLNGSGTSLVADGDHMFNDPSQPRAAFANCVEPWASIASVAGNTVVFGAGSGGQLNSIYAQTIGTPAQGTSDVPPDFPCALTGSAGPVVTNSLTPLPGDPTPGKQLPQYAYFQTDGANVYFWGSDWNFPCCAAPGGWSGLFSVPLSGGAVTKIAAVGDTLPGIGTVTSLGSEFSADSGGLVFAANSANAIGLFLARGGSITKVLATGDTLNGGTIGSTGNLEVYPLAYKGGNIAFVWDAGVYVAAPACAADVSNSVSVTRGGFLYNRATGQFAQQVTVTNTSSGTLTGPLALVLESLSSDATLSNASGASSCAAPGSPYITLGPGTLPPGASTTVTLDFTDPSRGGIAYSTAVTAGTGTP